MKIPHANHYESNCYREDCTFEIQSPLSTSTSLQLESQPNELGNLMKIPHANNYEKYCHKEDWFIENSSSQFVPNPQPPENETESKKSAASILLIGAGLLAALYAIFSD
ncbi:MAG: hypothetical protein LBT47_12275 [Deltaproteobacteria bacterium]|jgi:hypothetical protein|nr:hypothetical protein [Deltaproteobacteria bacterium]